MIERLLVTLGHQKERLRLWLPDDTSTAESLTGKYRLRSRAVVPLALLALIAIAVLTFAPESLFRLKTIALSTIMFICGIFLAQHAAIWEKDE